MENLPPVSNRHTMLDLLGPRPLEADPKVFTSLRWSEVVRTTRAEELFELTEGLLIRL